MPRESNHEMSCVPCARREAWIAHIQKCRTCKPLDGIDCAHGERLAAAYEAARAEATQ